MASVRKRTWSKGTPKEKTAWIADYFDQSGKRRQATFRTRREADAYLVQAKHQIALGTHTPASVSITIAVAAQRWLEQARADGLERSTLRQYAQHVNLHILPLLGQAKLADLSIASVKAFRNSLIEKKCSRVMAGKVVSSLGSILSDAMSSGAVSRNVAHEAAQLNRRHGNRQKRLEKRHERRLAEGVDYPTKDELRRMLAVPSRYRPLILTAVFTGLRASELRGLEWRHIDLDRGVLTVEQRADRWNVTGSPKSDSAKREIQLAPVVMNTLKRWRLECPRNPRGELQYVFPNTKGNIETLPSIHNRGLAQIQRAAGIESTTKGPKYGLHALRHVAATLWIEAGLSPKKVQTLMGHSTIGMTLDTYTHLWKSENEDAAAMAAAQARLLG